MMSQQGFGPPDVQHIPLPRLVAPSGSAPVLGASRPSDSKDVEVFDATRGEVLQRSAKKPGDAWEEASDSSKSSEGFRDVDFVLGPSELTGKFAMLGFSPGSVDTLASGQSTVECAVLSDTLHLTNRLDGQQLSFGSALHVGDGVNSLCLICSYHKPPNRYCAKGVLCDFCHFHGGKRGKKARQAIEDARAKDVRILKGVHL
ncbi:unnamed protein product [Cladocopium goreaui]|uniref:NADH-cytochrome b5 reductase 1 n=1 Tax=Cladocopium goreaui TaxID=2562237 RepID=A0A9P1FV13_9DINO|nr:unnamed protein product [Cladocopium goreaui]CAI3990619.1 unnamed protein product [Cladocopium goreaui]|mmetsp:Transcript_3851/g.8971  ORF Transcript_3851/g.8971 Transcript_3851/m.8971 type:complete len:202 (+) Transcript_3851:97-702(+)